MFYVTKLAGNSETLLLTTTTQDKCSLHILTHSLYYHLSKKVWQQPEKKGELVFGYRNQEDLLTASNNTTVTANGHLLLLKLYSYRLVKVKSATIEPARANGSSVSALISGFRSLKGIGVLQSSRPGWDTSPWQVASQHLCGQVNRQHILKLQLFRICSTK